MEGKIEVEDIETSRQGEHFYLASLLAAIRDGHVPRVADTPGLLVEQHAGTMVFDGDVKANGKIDLTFAWPTDPDEPLVIRDWKSCKTFNYVKRKEQLALDDQCIFYANEMVARGWKGSIIFEHFYLSTTSSKYRKVSTDPLSQKYLREKFLDMEKVVCDMKIVAQQELAEVTKDKTACSAFGGCFHLDPCGRVNVLKPGAGIMSGLNLAGVRGKKASTTTKLSPLAAKLNAAQEAELAPPTPPTRLEVLTDVVNSAASLMADLDWSTVDVEATQATFENDVYVLARKALGSSVAEALEPIKAALDGLEESDFQLLANGLGEIVFQQEENDAPAINPPDASPNFHPAPGEEPLRDLGMKNGTANKFDKNNIRNMRDLLSAVSDGQDLTALDGVGAGAAAEAQAMVIQHLLSGKDLGPQVTQFDPNEEAAARIAELEEMLANAEVSVEGEATDTFTLYVNCHVVGATPVQSVLAECFGDDLSELYAMDYDNGKKSVAGSFLSKLDSVKENFSEISFVGGGYFSDTVFEVLAPHADRIVRGS